MHKYSIGPFAKKIPRLEQEFEHYLCLYQGEDLELFLKTCEGCLTSSAQLKANRAKHQVFFQKDDIQFDKLPYFDDEEIEFLKEYHVLGTTAFTPRKRANLDITRTVASQYERITEIPVIIKKEGTTSYFVPLWIDKIIIKSKE